MWHCNRKEVHTDSSSGSLSGSSSGEGDGGAGAPIVPEGCFSSAI